MRRRYTAIAVMLWLTMTFWYWSRTVPLRPEGIIQAGAGQFFEGVAPTGELMISQISREKSVNGGVVVRHGPVECRDPFEPESKRLIFQQGDQITAIPHEGRIVISREGVAWLANIVTGEVSEPLPGFPTEPGWIYWLKNNRLLHAAGGNVAIYDRSTMQTVASLTGTSQLQWIVSAKTDRFVVVRANDRRPAASLNPDVRIIDLTTGDIDTRFGASASMGSVMLSPDSRYVIIHRAKALTVYDRETTAELWSADLTIKRYTIVRFEDDDRMLVIEGLDINDEPLIARWQLSDGKAETERPRKTAKGASRQVIDGTPYAIDTVITTRPIWEQAVIHARNQIDFWMKGSWGNRSDTLHRNTLVDTRTGAEIGLLPTGSISGSALPHERGLMVRSYISPDPAAAWFYSMPPTKDWGWLVRWALIPAAAMLVLQWLFLRRKPLAEVTNL